MANILTPDLATRGITLPEKGRIAGIMEQALARGENHYSALEGLLGSYGIAEEKIRETMPSLVASCRAHLPDPDIYSLRKDAAQLLESLRKKGIRMGLITDGRSVTQRRKIESLGLSEYFPPEMILISGETGSGKESPANFEHTVRLLPEASRFIYIGDNPAKDFLNPNLLGWETVCLLDSAGRNIHSQPPAEWPDGALRQIESLRELL